MPSPSMIVYHSSLRVGGGGEKVLEQILLALEKEGIVPILVVGRPYFATFTFFHKAYNEGRFPFYFLSRSEPYKGLVDAGRIIHSLKRRHDAKGLILSIGEHDRYLLLLRSLGLPTLAFFHTPPSYTRKKFFPLNRLLEMISRDNKLLTLVPSKSMVQVVKTILPHGRIITLPLPYDQDFYTPEWKSKRQDRICAVGRLSPEKGFGTVLRVARLLRVKYGVSFQLTIVGDVQAKHDNYPELIMQTISNYDLDDSVSLICQGDPSTIRQIYRESAVFLNFSEGFGGITNIEAMACGCVPVVGSNLADVVAGYGYACVDIDSAAQVLARLLNDPENPLKGRLASEYASQFFSNRAFKETFVSHLLGLINHPNDFKPVSTLKISPTTE